MKTCSSSNIAIFAIIVSAKFFNIKDFDSAQNYVTGLEDTKIQRFFGGKKSTKLTISQKDGGAISIGDKVPEFVLNYNHVSFWNN